MGQLRIAQAHHVAPRAERAGLVLRPGGARNFRDQVQGNKIANLSQDAELGAGWGYFEFIHPCRVAGARKKFQPISSISLGRLWVQLFVDLSGFDESGPKALELVGSSYFDTGDMAGYWVPKRFAVHGRFR